MGPDNPTCHFVPLQITEHTGVQSRKKVVKKASWAHLAANELNINSTTWFGIKPRGVRLNSFKLILVRSKMTF